jgi:hypothetical protein
LFTLVLAANDAIGITGSASISVPGVQGLVDGLKNKTESLRENFNEGISKLQYKGSKGRRLVVLLNNNRLSIASLNTNQTDGTSSALIMRFHTNPQPRFGMEWHKDESILNGTNLATVIYSTRLMGMYEVNSTIPVNNVIGTHYQFREWTWSNINWAVSNLTGTSDGKLIQIWVLGTDSKTSLKMNVSMSVSTEETTKDTETVTPFGFKYGIKLVGKPLYKMTPETASSWVLVKNIFSSNTTGSINKNSLVDGAARLNWTTNVMVDGNAKTISFNGYQDANSTEESKNIMNTDNDKDRDMNLDFACSRRMVTYTIPYFVTSFDWDPNIYVDNEVAMEQSGISSSGFSIRPTLTFGMMVVVALAAIMLL